MFIFDVPKQMSFLFKANQTQLTVKHRIHSAFIFHVSQQRLSPGIRPSTFRTIVYTFSLIYRWIKIYIRNKWTNISHISLTAFHQSPLFLYNLLTNLCITFKTILISNIQHSISLIINLILQHCMLLSCIHYISLHIKALVSTIIRNLMIINC